MFGKFEYIEEEKLIRFVEEIEQQLLSSTPYHFQYPNEVEKDGVWDKDFIYEIEKLNEQFLSSLTHNANLYMIYTRNSVTSEWKPRYLGERKSIGIRGRIRSHLITKNEKTGS